jgi:hypothetical protein
MPGIDILVPTYHVDFMWAEYALKSIKKFASGFRKVIVVSDNDGNIVPTRMTEIVPCEVIYKDLPTKWPAKLNHRKGYLWQQILKLNWMEYTDADAIMILDSDEMLTRPVSPSSFRDKHGRWRWDYREWKDAGSANMWKKPTEDVLKFEPEYEAMTCAPFILERKTTHNFIEYLKKIHGASDLYDVFFKYDMTLFSEYNAYGSYVYKFDNNTVYFNATKEGVPSNFVIKSWSYGGLSIADRQRRDALIA